MCSGKRHLLSGRYHIPSMSVAMIETRLELKRKKERERERKVAFFIVPSRQGSGNGCSADVIQHHSSVCIDCISARGNQRDRHTHRDRKKKIADKKEEVTNNNNNNNIKNIKTSKIKEIE